MKKLLPFLLLLSFVSFSSCSDNDNEDEVGINAIKDPIFKLYCLYYFDINNDKELSQDEIDSVKSISLGGIYFPINLQGIEIFRNLESLWIGGLEHLEGLDLTQNRKINTLQIAYCGIDKLNVKGLQELEAIYIYRTNLKRLDLSTNIRLKRINSSENPNLVAIKVWPSYTEEDAYLTKDEYTTIVK